MQTTLIQRQYDEVIAQHYDLDPQSMTANSLDRAIHQIKHDEDLCGRESAIRLLDVGVGTGMFLQRLRRKAGLEIQPFGLDLSQKMVDIAGEKIPDLVAAVDDAANLDAHFHGQLFDVICTHFMTGFVPIQVMAPKIASKLDKGGFWSFVGGTKAGFPKLRGKADSKILKLLFGGKGLEMDRLVHNPSGRDEVVRALEDNGFVIREVETFCPTAEFKNFDEFMDFGYRGGWLTPFVENLGLQKANRTMRAILNKFVFPIRDQHNIEVVLAQKSGS